MCESPELPREREATPGAPVAMHELQPRQMPVKESHQPQRAKNMIEARFHGQLLLLSILLLPRALPAQSPAAPPDSAPAASPPIEAPVASATDKPPSTPLSNQVSDDPQSPMVEEPATHSPAAKQKPTTESTSTQGPTSPATPPPAVTTQPMATASAGGPTNEAAGTPPPTAATPAADGTVSVIIAPAETPSPPPAAISPPTAGTMPVSRSPDSVTADQPEKSVATQLLEKILEPIDDRLLTPGNSIDPSLLYARPLPLLEALQRSGDRSRRLWITQAYWKVSAGYAGIRFATEAVDQLQLVAPGGDPHDQAVLDVAIAASKADLAAAHAELIAAQQQLADLVRLPLGEPPPWPVDRPLAGAYQTHFAAIFATRPATGRIRAIDRMLPSKHDAVEARATAFQAAEEAMLRAEADHARGKRPIEAVIAAHRMLQQQQHGFVDSLAAYNLDIAEYAMAVADVTVPDDRYVSMLIGTPIQWSPQPAQGVLPAGGLQPVDPQATLPRQ